MDISKIKFAEKADEGKWLTIKIPGMPEEKGCRVKLVGTKGSIYRNYMKKMLDGKPLSAETQKDFDLDDALLKSAELLAELTVDWEGFEEGNKKIPFSKEKAIEIYNDINFDFLKTQVDEFIKEEANFF